MARVVKLTEKPKRRRKPAKAKEQDTLVLTGHTEQADAFTKAKVAVEDAKAQLTAARAVLEPMAKSSQANSEKLGSFTKKVRFEGSAKNVTFTFKNTFTPMEIGCRSDVQDAVGPKFHVLFQEAETVTVREGAVDKLRAAVAKAGLDPADFFETKRVIKPVENFRRLRFDARSEMSDDENEALDEIVEQLAAKPTVTVG